MGEVTIHIEVCTDNSAFDDDVNIELTRIVQNAVQHINAKKSVSRKLFDFNGNRVGQMKTYVDLERWDDD